MSHKLWLFGVLTLVILTSAGAILPGRWENYYLGSRGLIPGQHLLSRAEFVARCLRFYSKGDANEIKYFFVIALHEFPFHVKI